MHAAQHLWSDERSLPKTLCLIFVFCVAMSIASSAQTFTSLVSFTGTSGANLGANPQSTLLQGVDGNFYGTTLYGGTGVDCTGGNGCGTVFKIDPTTDALTTLYSFCSGANCPDGAAPWAGLVQGTDGNFYGTTSQGGSSNDGTVFKITPTGTLTTLYSFSGGDGSLPKGALLQAGDGNLYGTTSEGGANNMGTVFQITHGGTLTTLYSFAGPDGKEPSAGLIQANDGNLYGTTSSGGANDDGTVFRIALQSPYPLTTLHSFNGSDGSLPAAALLQATDSNLYGTTSQGGSATYGTIFKIDLGGTLTTLHSFNGNDGSRPLAAVTQATDGNLYGTTQAGGSNGYGTIFNITPAGTLTVLHTFSGADGANVVGGLVEGTDGNFYGTTSTGGTNNYGTVFKLSTGLNPYLITLPTSGTFGTPVTILGTNLSGATNVDFNGTPATFTVVSSSEIATIVPAGATTGPVRVAVPGNSIHTWLDFEVTGPPQLVPVTPCRVVDTRRPNGPFGGPSLQGGTERDFAIPDGPCPGIPSNAEAYSLNVTVVPPGPLGYLTIWPTGEIRPNVSTMNSYDGRVKANAAIVTSGYDSVSVYVTDTTDVILDIDGYFASPPAGTDQFYPLAPCRIVDTRIGQGGVTLQGGVESDFTIAGQCGIPSSGATAYSLNITVLPTQGTLGYLTVWPQGEARPDVSTLNDPTGTVVANAAIVPAGSSPMTAFYPYDNDTDLLVDVNGYFAPAGSGGLSFYPAPPCRVFDTRTIGNGQPFVGLWPGGINVTASSCAPPAEAQAFVFNATVVPSGVMPFITLWPAGQDQRPTVSTLNAFDGFVTSNMAIVVSNVSGSQGSINAYADGLTQLILDISGYFAPDSGSRSPINSKTPLK